MIKLVCFIRKRPDLDVTAFQKHWRENHGPLINSLPKLRRHLVRYEQNQRLDSDYARDQVREEAGADARDASPDTATPGYEGSTIMWFESMKEYHAFAGEPDYAEHIAPDEAKFMDRAQTLFFFTGEEDVKFGDASTQSRSSVKLLALLRRRPDLSPEQFHAHWAGTHARLFSENSALREQILAYQQNHRFAEDYARDPETSWDGLAEQWYESLEAFYTGAGGAPFNEIVVPDEERFIDRPATQFILTGPAEIIVQ